MAAGTLNTALKSVATALLMSHVSCHVRLPPGRGLLRPVCQEAEPDREEGVAADEAEKLVGLDGGVAVGVVQGEGRLHLVRVAVGRGLGLGLGFLGWALGFQGRLHELLDESICRELRGAAVVEGGARHRDRGGADGGREGDPDGAIWLLFE